MMKKLDIQNSASDLIDKKIPLLSQNISIIEVGAFSQIFELFIDFIGIKSLIITDLDAVQMKTVQNKNGKDRLVAEACRVSIGTDFSNTSLKYFLKGKTLEDLKTLPLEEKCLIKDSSGWVPNINGILCIVYQTECNSYFPRSFEDSFFAITKNLDLVKKKLARFRGIKNPRYFGDSSKDVYDLANECIDKKTHFALDIIYNSNDDYSNWDIPQYIEEGILWLKEN